MSNKEKAKQLGMPQGTAANRLRKMIMFSMMVTLGLDDCWQCGEKIEEVKDLSIEHKIPWLHSEDPVRLFFDLDNIAFSHLKCNNASARYNTDPEKLKGPKGSKAKHGTDSRYSYGCRCERCTQAHTEYQKKYRQIPGNRKKHSEREKERSRQNTGFYSDSG